MPSILIDNNKCKSCYLCIEACPKKIIKKSSTIGKTGNSVVEFDDKKNKCIGCAMCAISCPDLAIIEVTR